MQHFFSGACAGDAFTRRSKGCVGAMMLLPLLGGCMAMAPQQPSLDQSQVVPQSWAIAEPAMIEALSAAKQGTDMFSSGLCQMVTALAFERGVPEAIRPHILSMYRARRDALCAAMETHLSDWFTWEKPEGGMFVWARARDSRLNTDALMRAGLAEGVCISPSSVFDPAHRDHGGMRLNFTLNPPEKLEEGIRRLARTTRAVLRDAA